MSLMVNDNKMYRITHNNTLLHSILKGSVACSIFLGSVLNNWLWCGVCVCPNWGGFQRGTTKYFILASFMKYLNEITDRLFTTLSVRLYLYLSVPK